MALLEKRRYLNNRSGDFPQEILIIPSHVPNTAFPLKRVLLISKELSKGYALALLYERNACPHDNAERVADPNLHYFCKLDPGPHYSEKLDPDQ